MSTERRGEVIGLNAEAENSASSRRENLLQKQTTIRKQIIGFSTAAAVSLGGLGFSLYKTSGIQEGLSNDLPRPSQTELSQAQSIQNTYHNKVTLYENCNKLYNPETCQNLQVVPDDKLKEAERTIAQEQAFTNEAGQRKDRWFYATLAFYSIFGASGLAALSRQFSLDDVKRKMRKSVQPDAQI